MGAMSVFPASLKTITLARHGAPDAPFGRWMGPRRFRAFLQLYDRCPILPDSSPPPKLMALAKQASAIFATPTVRSRESAMLLAPDKPPVVDAVFVEAPVVSAWAPLYLPATAWVAIARLLWLAGLPATETPSETAKRAEGAAERLIQRAGMTGHVLLVGHGWLNRLIGQALEQRGWQTADAGSHGYWSHQTYTAVAS